MFEQYPKFFRYLGTRSSSIQDELGSDAADLARLLRKYPEVVAPSRDTAIDYALYLKTLIRFGALRPTLAPLFTDYFGDRVIAWALEVDADPIGPILARRKNFSMQQLDLIQLGRHDAMELAELLEHAGDGAAEDAVEELVAYDEPADGVFEGMFGHTYSARVDLPQAMPSPAPETPVFDTADADAPAAGEPPRRDFFVTAHELSSAAGEERIGPSTGALASEQAYALRMGVARAKKNNLAQGNTVVVDVPAGGLSTHWVVVSRDVDFIAEGSNCQVRRAGSFWEASFDLHVPAQGDSAVHELRIRTGAALGELQVAIYAVGQDGGREMYRELTVDLGAPSLIARDDTVAAASQLLLTTTHEWTTPRFHVHVRLWKETALVTMRRGAQIKDYTHDEDWNITAAELAPFIHGVRDAFDRLRENWSEYFDAIDAADLAARLAERSTDLAAHMQGGWGSLPSRADAVHEASFQAMSASDEWREFATAGYALYNTCFAAGTRLRAMLDELEPGSRVDFQWTEGSGRVPHVPWALMNLRMPDVTRVEPIDPEGFLGLRFRLASQAWATHDPSRALASATPTHALNLLYWGSEKEDPVATESAWQSAEFAGWGQSVLPDLLQADPKLQVVKALDQPAPEPVGVVYFYCHCSVADDRLVLRFGESNDAKDRVTHTDLSFRKFATAPMVFANACSTATADPFQTGMLESRFFDRGVRAYVGTEIKVPVQLASKFAWLFFQLFYRRHDPKPMAAGEALTQARMFLWQQYRNVGGLFYGLVNQYDLYFATDAEVAALKE
ncbi:MAG: CHAT domain-containing protein [Gammaproteobacteria bacterium]|nr:CHAT domain-containing protein [Gammaproteobacteria bacterium]